MSRAGARSWRRNWTGCWQSQARRVKSSYSGSQGGNCVEAAADGVGRVLVRDTKDRGGAVLEFRASRWREFSASLKAVSQLSNCPKSRKAGIAPENVTKNEKSPQAS